VVATLATLAAWATGHAPPLPFFGALAAQTALAVALRRRTVPVVRGAERALRDLSILRDLLARIEREPVEAPRLVALQRALETSGRAPSERIEQLQKRVDLLDARRNQFFAPIGALLLWTTQLALSLEMWRAECGAALPSWIESSGEFEALAALSGYAYECPSDPFPELWEEGPLFDAVGLGHPLLPDDRCVRNDLHLGSDRRAWVVSGSNMSGKSTLLRSVGTNTLLALVGAPVRARSLRLSPLAIGASIQVHDSLREGRSRFYAEIERLHQIVVLAEGDVPALFLLDEILHGTNSHDRRIGAEALVKGLLGRGAVGLVTTHDLALAKMADVMGGEIANAHFEDHLEDGQIQFDYELRPGVVRKSNALALMRAVGLEV
jgi:DNA mismatch repair ATPase MutS